jgi:small-conductance mechanosensitive channel
MTYRFFSCSVFCLWLFFCCLCITVPAQQTDTTQRLPARAGQFLQKARAFGQAEAIRSIEKYRVGHLAIEQEKLLQELRHTVERAKLLLRKGIDTAFYQTELKITHSELELVRDGIFEHPGSAQTTRNLAVTSSILSELLLKMTERRNELGRYVNTLTDIVDHIDSVSADSVLYTFAGDSLQTIQYVRKLAVLARELGPTDTALRKTVGSLQVLETGLDMMVVEIRSNLEDVERYRGEQIEHSFDAEFPALWEAPLRHRAFGEIVAVSAAKERLALVYYLHDFRGRLVIVLLLILASWYFLHSLKKKWVQERGLDPQFKGQLVVRYPLLSAILLVLNIFQFLFLQPPFVFGACIWLISAICLGILFYRFIAGFWMRFWVVMVLLFVLAALTNMQLQASRPERWWMLLLSLTGVSYSIYVLRSPQRKELKEKGIVYFIGFVVFAEGVSILLNLTGRYNLAKTMLVSGYAGLVIAILFLWTVRLINEGLVMISNVYKHPDRKLFYIDFTRIGERVPRFFYVFLVVGWFILVARNFYAFQEAATPFMEFLTAERVLGNYTFTINSIFIFVVILLVSVILSQVISFFASDPGDQRNKDKLTRRAGVGSWLLLIRIFVLALGLFFAFAAAGIPIDKLTIVLGALGVGIGLGLQGLVSNLVSGLIIAFEKPVNVGDIIEVNGQLGTMKTIGFRSSVVSLIDGACLIIPNSDLLSNHLVNWTMGHNRRRLNVLISVAYGSDLKKVKAVLESVLKSHEKVLQFPEPIVSVKAFEDSSIDIDLYFWVGHVRDFLGLRNDVITLVNEAFLREGITVPFPQQDIHIINDGK